MNRLLKIVGVWLLCVIGGSGNTASAITDSERCEYVIDMIGLNKIQAKQFRPVLLAYLKECNGARLPYERAKTRLKKQINSHRLSETQAKELLTLRWQRDEKELALRKKYELLFHQALSLRDTYSVFLYANDSKDKIAKNR